jgi:hypothetical protein
MSNAAEVERLLALSEEELLAELGAALVGPDVHGLPEAITTAREWLERKRGLLYQAVCAEDRWPKLAQTLDKYEMHKIVIIVADTWLKPRFANLPVLNIATILVKQGLDYYCGLK